jgi:hypothetical protein
MPDEKITDKAIALCELYKWPVTYDNVQNLMHYIEEHEQIVDKLLSELQ